MEGKTTKKELGRNGKPNKMLRVNGKDARKATDERGHTEATPENLLETPAFNEIEIPVNKKGKVKT